MSGTSATSVGQDIGGFLGGILSPVIGQTTTVENVAPSASAVSTKKTGTIVIAILAVVTVIIVGYLLLKNKTTA